MSRQTRAHLFNVLYALGFRHLLQWVNRLREKVPVLLFHRVTPAWDMFTEPLHPEKFEKLIILLKKRYQLRPLDHLFTHRPVDLKESAFITFDDATADFAAYAWPILSKYEIPTTLFVPIGLVDKGQLWNLQLFEMFLNSPMDELEIKINNTVHTIVWSTPSFYKNVMKLHDHLLQINIAERTSLMKMLEARLKPKITGQLGRLVNSSQLLDMSKAGLDIQVHSWDHDFLPSIGINNELHDQFERPLKAAQEMFTTSCTGFAYPNGGYDANIVNVCSQYYKYGMAVNEQMVRLRHIKKDRYTMPRFNVHDANPEEVLFRINGFHNMFKS
jgi:peptidoglycan/xylan/chitin deacetylase (PgdA/CDA1 family)